MSQCEYSQCNVECEGRFCKPSHSTLYYRERRAALEAAKAAETKDDSPFNAQPSEPEPFEYAGPTAAPVIIPQAPCKPTRTDHKGRVIE